MLLFHLIAQTPRCFALPPPLPPLRSAHPFPFPRSAHPFPSPPLPSACRRYQHPICDRVSEIVVGGDYITTEAGTGLVHTAPGHGQEDYATGLKYGLPLLSPVDDAGRFTAEAGERFKGMSVLKVCVLAGWGVRVCVGRVFGGSWRRYFCVLKLRGSARRKRERGSRTCRP